MKKTWFGVAVLGGLAVSLNAANVSFDNDAADLNYFNPINWSDNTTVPNGGGFTDTATISNFVISITNSVSLTGNGAGLQLLNGTAFNLAGNPAILGIGSGCCGATVIVDSNAVLRGQGSISGTTVGRILLNVSGGFAIGVTPASTVELKPGATLSNLLIQTSASGNGNIGDTFRIIGDGATIRGVAFGNLSAISPSLYLTNTFVTTGPNGGDLFLRFRRGQTLSLVGTSPAAPTFSLVEVLIDDLAVGASGTGAGTSGGRLIVSGGSTNLVNNISRLALGIAPTASGATSSVQVINGARVFAFSYLKAGADNTQDLNDNNGSTVSVNIGSNSLVHTRGYVALGSRASLSGEGEIQINQESPVLGGGAGGFLTYQTNATLFDGRNLTFTMSARFLIGDTTTNTVRMEVAGKDLGAEVTIPDVTNNFYIGKFNILTNTTTGVRTTSTPTFRLIDLVDNANDAAVSDALYVGSLNIQSNTIVDLNGLHLYYFGQRQEFQGVTFLNGAPTFIPEPSALALLSLAVVGSMVIRRKR